MKMPFRLEFRMWIMLTLTIGFSSTFLIASTTFMGAAGKTVLAATNEDYPDPMTYVRFVPAEGESYGAVYFGYDDAKPTGGLNDQGLFVNLSTTPRWQVLRDPDKKTLFGNLIENLLTKCSTIDDVLKLEDSFNLYDLHQAQIMVADQKGNAIILEGNNIIHKESNYLLMTNFYQSTPDTYPLPKTRYELADKMLSNNKPSEKLFLQVLSATHREIERPTMYSLLCNLKQKEIQVFQFHDYQNGISINVKDALKKGARTILLSELFGKDQLAFEQYKTFQRKNRIDENFRNGQIVQAVSEIFKWSQEDENFNAYPEFELNMMGYQMMGADNLAGAIEVFKLNVALFPQSGNVYDSLGESYMNNGETDLAIKNYEKSLELDPNNTNAVEMLKRLRNED